MRHAICTEKIHGCIFLIRVARGAFGFRKVSASDKFLLKSTPHKQERALATRRDLIEAARTIFARDGYESARVEDIAAAAKKTRGAFYANFNDKEDVFFAIFEADLLREEGKIQAAVAAASSEEQKVNVLADHLAALLEDRERLLLNLEFKMYVIRHPQKRRRLNQLYSEMCLRCAMTKISSLMPELSEEDREERLCLTTEVGAVMDGLALNVLFSPESITLRQRRRYLRIAVQEAMRAVESMRTATKPEAVAQCGSGR